MNGKIAHPTVLASHLRDDGIMDGCNHYRFRIPFEEMRVRVGGGVFDWAPMSAVRDWAASSAEFKPTSYDMLLLPRHRPLPYEKDWREILPERLVSGAKALGAELEGVSHLVDMVNVLKLKQSVVLEYDDDYFTKSRDLNYEHHDLLNKLLESADAVTVSTDYLAKIIRRCAPGVPVYILPNCVKWSEWQDNESLGFAPEDHVVIGLTGSRTHHFDWMVLKDVMPTIIKEFANVTFLMAGFLPEYFVELEAKEERVKYIGVVAYEEYPTVVRQTDITLCPVDPHDEFNMGKSGLKAIEGLAAGRKLPNGRTGGSVPITSELYYYQRVTGTNKRGLSISHTPEAWYDAIKTLITDNELRMKLAQRGRSWVYGNRSIERQWGQWWAAYKEIHRRKR